MCMTEPCRNFRLLQMHPFAHVFDTISSIYFFSLVCFIWCACVVRARQKTVPFHVCLTCLQISRFIGTTVRIIEKQISHRLICFPNVSTMGIDGNSVRSGAFSIHLGVISVECVTNNIWFESIPFSIQYFVYSFRCSGGGNRIKPCVQWITWLYQTIRKISMKCHKQKRISVYVWVAWK